MNRPLRISSTRIAVRPLQRIARVLVRVQRGVHDRAGERHEQRGGDALAGDVGDDDAERPAPAVEAEQLEEVTADLAGRLVVAREVVAGHVRRDERHEAALRRAAPGQAPRQRAERGLGRCSRRAARGQCA